MRDEEQLSLVEVYLQVLPGHPCRDVSQIFSHKPVWQREGKTGKAEYHQHNSDRKSIVIQLLSQERHRGNTAEAPVQSPVGLL